MTCDLQPAEASMPTDNTATEPHCNTTVTHFLQSAAKRQLMGWIRVRQPNSYGSLLLRGENPPYRCRQNATARLSGPAPPEFVMQPLTPDGSLSEGLSMPGARATGRFGRHPRPDSLPRLNGRQSKEAFCKQDRQRGANAGQGRGEPRTYCQVLN